MDYRSPGSVREAVDLLAAHGGGAQVLAGGTDLLVKLRARLRRPGAGGGREGHSAAARDRGATRAAFASARPPAAPRSASTPRSRPHGRAWSRRSS